MVVFAKNLDEGVGNKVVFPSAKPRNGGVANCSHCGRFCRVSPASYEYDGNGTQCYITFYCSKCGTYTEGMW